LAACHARCDVVVVYENTPIDVTKILLDIAKMQFLEGGGKVQAQRYALEHLEQHSSILEPSTVNKAIKKCHLEKLNCTNASKFQKNFRKCPPVQNVGIFK